jgi:O-6-methylguanine DNA methyltransferase
LDTPIGRIYVVTDGTAVVEIAYERPDCPEVRANHGALRQLEEYFAGERISFDVEINLGKISRFYTAIYSALSKIPYAATCSYRELAELAGSPRAARAAGQAMSGNPLPIIIPCHRVIASDGSLGGYTGGIGVKEKLLALERRYEIARRVIE